MRYRAYGLVVESQEPIAELSAIGLQETEAPTQISIEPAIELPAPDDSGDVPPPMPELDWPEIERAGAGYRLRFSDESVFWVAADGRQIRCLQSMPGATDRHYLLDHVLPRVLDLWGLNPLHATAVATSQGVLAFLGATGTGKSTMAAALVARGALLVSDDCLVLERSEAAILAVPSYPGLRLHEDVCEILQLDTGLTPVADYTSKQRVTGGVRLTRGNRPLLAVYLLERDEDSDASRLSPAEFMPVGPANALIALAGSAFRMDVGRREQHRRQLSFYAEVVRAVPIRRCAFGNELSNVGALADAVLRDAATSVR